MHITVRNLGVVREAEINLKPLTVFVGPNNSGKTWTAYALAAIFGPFGLDQFVDECNSTELSKRYPPLHTAMQQVLEEGNAKIDLEDFAATYGQQYINDVAACSRKWLRRWFGTRRVDFSTLDMTINLEATDAFPQKVRQRKLNNPLSEGRNKKAVLRAFKDANEPTLFFYSEGDVLAKLPESRVREFILENVFALLQKSFFRFVYTLPTERTTFITIPLATRSSTTRRRPAAPDAAPSSGDTTEADRIGGPFPVGEFLGMMSSLYRASLLEREERAKDDSAISTYIQLAALLETGILNGSVDFSTPEPDDPRREILFQAAGAVSLDMNAVSSMVKELSALVLYLRYAARKGDWLIIDEPEMNLHPEAQVRMIEFLAMLVDAGLKVLITTHSPYMVDHLANLIKASRHPDKDAIRNEFRLGRTEAFIAQRDVSVHLFENGTTQNILTDDGLIDWSTFGRVSDYISEIYSDI